MFNPLWSERTTMTPLRKRLIEDLQLKGYAQATQLAYLKAVCKLARHYKKSPDQISEEELRAYFLHLVQVEHCARETLKIAISGIRFFFAVTLQRQRKYARCWVVCERRFTAPVSIRSMPVDCALAKEWPRKWPTWTASASFCAYEAKATKVRQVTLSEPTLESLRVFWKFHRSKPWLFPARLQPRSRND